MGIGIHEYLNAFINSSVTVAEIAGDDLVSPAHKAAMYDANGGIIPAVSGDKAIGLILSNTSETVKKGEPVHILIKDIGLMEAGEALSKGDPVTVNASGCGVKAGSGQFVFGLAMTAATVGECAQVLITRSGQWA